MSDDQSDDKINAEHHEVGQLADVESEARRDEEKIPKECAQGREKQSRSAMEAQSGDGHREKIEQRYGPVASKSKDCQREYRDNGCDENRDSVFVPAQV